MFLLLSAGCFLVWIGRTATNGMNYLDGMSIYQYYPTLFLAAAVGFFLQETLDDQTLGHLRRGFSIASVMALIALMGFSSCFIIPRYMVWNKPISDFLKKMKIAIQMDPNIRFDPSKVKFPFTPSHAIPYPEHAYQITKLLFKDNVIRREEMEALRGEEKEP